MVHMSVPQFWEAMVPTGHYEHTSELQGNLKNSQNSKGEGDNVRKTPDFELRPP